mgnify:FL=1
MHMSFCRFVPMICALLVASCVVPAPTQVAPPALEQSVRSQIVPDNKARVLFYLGKVDGNAMFLGAVDVRGPSDLLANGQIVGSVNYQEVVAVDLSPGKYEMFWKQRVKGEEGLASAPVTITLKSGQTAYLRADITQTTIINFGPVNKYVLSLDVCYSSCQLDLNKKKIVVTAP